MSFLKDNAGLGQGENEWLKQLQTAAGLSKTGPSPLPLQTFFFFFFSCKGKEERGPLGCEMGRRGTIAVP